MKRSDILQMVKSEDVYLKNVEGDYYMRIKAGSTHDNLMCFGKLKGRPEFQIAWYGTMATEILLNGTPISAEEYQSGRNQANHPRVLH